MVNRIPVVGLQTIPRLIIPVAEALVLLEAARLIRDRVLFLSPAHRLKAPLLLLRQPANPDHSIVLLMLVVLVILLSLLFPSRALLMAQKYSGIPVLPLRQAPPITKG